MMYLSLRRLAPLAAGLWLLPVALGRGQGTIVYFRYDPPLNYAGVPFPPYNFREIDMDSDGQFDYAIRAGPAQVDVLMSGNNRVIALPATPPDMGSYVVPLSYGDQIGSSLSPVLSWVGTNDFPGYAGMSACYDAGCAGIWVGLTGYMGVELDSGGNTYYGWVQILNGGIGSAGYIYDWAYEARPNTPIFAGAVPEPSTWALLSAGGILFWLLGRRKRMA